jgi:DHA2 family multidrug resistance protein
MVARSSGPAISARQATPSGRRGSPREQAVRSSTQAPGPALVTKHPRVIMGAVMMATMMQMVDSTIANVALPHMQASFSAALDQISWVLTSYILATAIATPLIGWLSSRFGRKHVFLASIAGFTAASMMCGWAQSLEQMVVFRLLQGALGAMLGPLSQSIMFDLSPPGQQMQSMAVWSIGTILGPLVAPALGGWLTDEYSWRWCFFVNAPVGILAFAGLATFLPEDRHQRGISFDFFGFGMLAVAIGSLQLLLDRGQQLDWLNSNEILIEAGLTFLGLWLFGVHSATAAKPFFSARLFSDRTFLSSIFIAFITFALMFSSTALMPQLLQNLLGYPVFAAGMLSMPRGFGSILGSLMVPRLSRYIDRRIIMLTGMGFVCLSMWQMLGFSLHMDDQLVIWSGFIQGFGVMLTFIPLNVHLFSSLPVSLRTEAMGFFALVRSLAGSIGISIGTTMLARNIQVAHSDLAAHATVFNRVLNHSTLGGFWNLHTRVGLAALDAEINRQAAMVAYIDDFKLFLIAMIAAAPLLLLLKTGSQLQRSSEPSLAPPVE